MHVNDGNANVKEKNDHWMTPWPTEIARNICLSGGAALMSPIHRKGAPRKTKKEKKNQKRHPKSKSIHTPHSENVRHTPNIGFPCPLRYKKAKKKRSKKKKTNIYFIYTVLSPSEPENVHTNSFARTLTQTHRQPRSQHTLTAVAFLNGYRYVSH